MVIVIVIDENYFVFHARKQARKQCNSAMELEVLPKGIVILSLARLQ